jgi:hypothetical protein
MTRGSTVTEAVRAVQRSNLSSRSAVLREANRRGKWFGMVRRFLVRIGRADAKRFVAESVEGRDGYGHCAVPERWRALFVSDFVKAAVYAAHTTRSVCVRGR